MAATVYTARTVAGPGTLAAPPLLNEIVGDPKTRATNADNTLGGQVTRAPVTADGGTYNYGGVNRPNA